MTARVMKSLTENSGVAMLAALLLGLVGCAESERRPSGRPQSQVAPAAPALAASPVGRPSVWPEFAPQIYAQSAILIDAGTGRVLYEKNADMRRQVASTQKLLTAILIAERRGLDTPIVIEASDTRAEPTKLGFLAGQTYSRRSLLTAIMVKSSNDAAAALARDHSGSIPAFAAAMNRRASELGAQSSYFANPHGLPAEQFSTARDVARIAYRAYRFPDLRAMMLMPSYTFRFNSGRTKRLEATNKLLTRSSMFNGMKTGYTHAARRCLVTSATLGNRSLILVQLGSETRYIFDDAERMIQWGFGQGGPSLATNW